MSELINRLRAEHAEIIDILLRVKTLIGRHEHGREKLMAAEDFLTAHLRSEDSELYPVLAEAALKDEDLKKQLVEHVEEMNRVSEAARSFFEKYSNHTPEEKPARPFVHALKKLFSPKSGAKAESPNGGFEEDFQVLYGLILDRIRKEENILYAAYLKHKRG